MQNVLFKLTQSSERSSLSDFLGLLLGVFTRQIFHLGCEIWWSHWIRHQLLFGDGIHRGQVSVRRIERKPKLCQKRGLVGVGVVGDALAKTRSKACRPGVVFPPTARQAAHSSPPSGQLAGLDIRGVLCVCVCVCVSGRLPPSSGIIWIPMWHFV